MIQNCSKFFLDHKVSPPKGNWDSWLWQSFKNRHPHIADQLLKHGAQIGGIQQDGLNLTEISVKENQPSFVKVLLAHKVPTGNALAIASEQGDQDMIMLLLAHGASVKQTHSLTKDTPLNVAIRNKHDHIATLLIEKERTLRFLSVKDNPHSILRLRQAVRKR
ncbi:MAG: ankyrin repeat domain-containing protein [Akkermansiaceae bacterium]|nr:ankyrin repeat domain-containing protein [Akkermansiaceae bacterium]